LLRLLLLLTLPLLLLLPIVVIIQRCCCCCCPRLCLRHWPGCPPAGAALPTSCVPIGPLLAQLLRAAAGVVLMLPVIVLLLGGTAAACRLLGLASVGFAVLLLLLLGPGGTRHLLVRFLCAPIASCCGGAVPAG
jgi:hypothetical protein